MGERTARRFYLQDTIVVARELLGRVLTRRLPDGHILSGRIIETEAYLGLEDPACHSFEGRRTPRIEAMYSDAGTSYVYFIYGVHFCFNVVTGGPETPEAVLVRALEPLQGIDLMKRTHPDRATHEIANGPGKLCAALGIGRNENGLDLVTSKRLWIEEPDGLCQQEPRYQILEGPRVGLGHRHDAVHWPLRFGLAGPAGGRGLSKPRFP